LKGLREKRIQKGMTQLQVANHFGLPYNTYWQYEYGTRHPKIELLKQFADFFGCTIDELL
jgi:transcriptional regulator with XRE-family HTH domain